MGKRDEINMQETEPAEIKLTVDDFLSEIPNSQVEMRESFRFLCKQEQIGGHKLRAEWKNLLELYNTMPSTTSWPEWSKGRV